MTAPVNDDFADAQVITGATGAALGIDLADATYEVDEPDGKSGDPGFGSVWFEWTAPADAVKTRFWTEGAWSATNGTDPLLGVFTGATVDALTPVTPETISGDDAGYMSNPIFTFTPTPSATYWVQVDAWDYVGTPPLGTGPFDLRWAPAVAAARDAYASREDITDLTGSLDCSTLPNGTTEGGEGAPLFAAATEWLVWTCPDPAPLVESFVLSFSGQGDPDAAAEFAVTEHCGLTVSVFVGDTGSLPADEDDLAARDQVEGDSGTVTALLYGPVVGTEYPIQLALGSKWGTVGTLTWAGSIPAPEDDDPDPDTAEQAVYATTFEDGDDVPADQTGNL